MSEKDVNPDAAVEDTEDVEAHGMREVVAGLGAAAVLTGGAAAMVSQQQQGGAAGGASTIHATDAIAADDTASDAASATRGGSPAGPASFQAPREQGAAAGQGAVGQVTGAVQDVESDDVSSPNRVGLMGRADDRVDSAVGEVRELRDAAVSDAGDVTEAAGQKAQETLRSAAGTVREAPETAREAVENLREGTVTTPDVRETVRSADRAVDATIVLAGDTVRSVTGTAMTTIARIQPGVGSDVDLKDASGWVKVTVGGEEVARAEVKDGQASVSWQAPDVSSPVVFHFSGNDVLKAASVTL